MDFTLKVVIAVIAGLLVLFVMKTMTKWVFRIIIIGIIIGIVFYSSISLEDMKGVFKKEPVAQKPLIEEPVVEETPEIAGNATIEENATSAMEQGMQ